MDRHPDLSVRAKQTFSVVTLLATVLVVGIHYKSNVPSHPDAAMASWNELAQEFCFGGIARVAVPIFAFAAGLFYYRSDDGTLACYRAKLAQRFRTVAMPYFIVGSIATVVWLLVRRGEGKPIDLTAIEFVSMWILRPPAEQLWFLRDLMVLVAMAPIIRWCCSTRVRRRCFLGLTAIAWALNCQAFPLVAGWRLLQMETLLFFSIGCVAVRHADLFDRVGRCSMQTRTILVLAWIGLAGLRIAVRADFDIWYANDHGLTDLLLHQASIGIGMIALFSLAWQMNPPWLIRLSGGSFFVYLVHEFPLRAMAHRLSDRLIDHEWSCWALTPTVLLGTYSTVMVLGRYAPRVVAIITGGRVPRREQATMAKAKTSSIEPASSGI